MKTYILSLGFLVVALCLSAQEETSVLKIRGQSKISVKPNLTVVSFGIKALHSNYSGTVEELTKRVDLLTDVLKKAGFKEEEILTANFSINKNIVYERGTRKDSGYVANQVLFVEFVQDKDKLLDVLNKTTGSKADPSISISFSLDESKKREIRDLLIKGAVEDAHRKAKLICKTSGCEIESIKEIDYGADNQIFPSFQEKVLTRASMDTESQVSSFEASDLTFQDEIKMVFIFRKTN